MFALDINLTAEQRLFREVTRVLDHERYMALAGLAQLGEIRIDENCPTAYTNFKDIVFGRKFIERITDAQLRFAIIHELYHMAYCHMAQFKWMWDKHPETANRTWDEGINGRIVKENKIDQFAQIHPDWLNDPRFEGMHEVEIWKVLFKEQEEKEGGDGEGEDGEGEGEDGEGESNGSFDEHDVEAYDELSKEEQEEHQGEVEEALRQGLLAAKKSGHPSNLDLEELIEITIPWEDIVQEWMTTTCSGGEDGTFRIPNRQYLPMDIIRPSRIQDKLNDLIIAIDMSGSVGKKERTKFLSITRNVIETLSITKIHILYWDTEVRSHETYGETAIPLSELLNTTKPKGGGGTDVTCVANYVKDKRIEAEGIIVLTDGYIWSNDWGTWDAPVLWAILNNKGAQPTVGKKVNVTIN